MSDDAPKPSGDAYTAQYMEGGRARIVTKQRMPGWFFALMAAAMAVVLGTGLAAGTFASMVGIIPLALVVALSPLSIIPAVLILQSPRPRPGGLADVLFDQADESDRLPAPRILELLLRAFGPIWQDRLTLGGICARSYTATPVDGAAVGQASLGRVAAIRQGSSTAEVSSAITVGGASGEVVRSVARSTRR